MSSGISRYPGAQPFNDDETSSRVFFGREKAAIALTDKILATRLVVVYALSGLGKTSLLQAGVAPRLRSENLLPVFVRLNDTRLGPVESVLNSMATEAMRQNVEYIPGSTQSLWHAFKTAEFWRGDLMLTPVLILDQFEELFTLQDDSARSAFLDQLGYLARGARPIAPLGADDDGLTESAPAVHIVISLREDYLGYLEDAADHIPQIFDSRFRLTPLGLESAREAVTGPARIDDPIFDTPPFSLQDETADYILNYLSKKRSRTYSAGKRTVDPFQLQLVCRRVEDVARSHSAAGPDSIAISVEDVGGAEALNETLKGFYGTAIAGIGKRSQRQAAQRLCEEYLISPEGRRLSLEEGEIGRQLNIGHDVLGQLVESRLLRSDNRSESRYYELSHDALVEPVLAASRRKSVVYNWFGVGFSTALLIIATLVLLVLLYAFESYVYETETAILVGEIIGQILLVGGLLTMMVGSVFLLRKSYRSIYRFQRAREADGEKTERQVSSLSRMVSGVSGIGGGVIVITFGVFYLFAWLLLWTASFNEAAYSMAQSAELTNYVDVISSNGIGADLLSNLVVIVAFLRFGARAMRWGALRLAGHSRAKKSPGAISPARRALRSVAACIYLTAAALFLVMCIYTFQCGYIAIDTVPGWLSDAWFALTRYDCMEGYPEGAGVELGYGLLGIAVTLYMGVVSLRSRQ
jgi:UPF0716 family protein affecting phage T7 exclusion